MRIGHGFLVHISFREHQFVRFSVALLLVWPFIIFISVVVCMELQFIMQTNVVLCC